jgi:hypothetical protein
MFLTVATGFQRQTRKLKKTYKDTANSLARMALNRDYMENGLVACYRGNTRRNANTNTSTLQPT